LREVEAIAELRRWYLDHARDLPWRVSPENRAAGDVPNPYRVWLSEIMLQQTTVAAVIPYFEAFTRRWPTVSKLAAAEDEAVMTAWAGLGYYARARNLLKCARVVAGDLSGTFPDTEGALRTLPGIGPYTAAAVAAIAFDRAAVVVDGNVERVVARLHAVETPLPKAKPVLNEMAAALTPATHPGDHAQAMMDLGATICTPRNPACGICPLMGMCRARKSGDPGRFPLKERKKPKPVRQGIAWLATRTDGAVLLETRPDKGLLGGMLGVPSSDWVEGAPDTTPPFRARWADTGHEVRHTFTHFHLILNVHQAVVEGAAPEGLRWRKVADTDLPTVMRKVVQSVRAKKKGVRSP